MDKIEKLIHCSFCQKPHTLVKKMIAGPAVFICNECIKICQEIIDEAAGKISIESRLTNLEAVVGELHKKVQP